MTLLPATPSSSLPPPNRPVIRRTFGANADDYAEQTPPSTVDTARPVRSVSIYGCFTAVRAAAVLHQYDIGFWGDSGIIAMVAAATTPDPTQDQLVQMYQDFLLLSYLPDSMVPTQAQFNDLATPSKQAAVLTANLPLMGITTDPTSANDATVVDEANTVPSTLPTPAPYAASISQFCDGSQIFSPTTLVGGA